MLQPLAIGMPGPFEWVIIAGLALMIFGNRLPSLARNAALGIRGFKQALKDVEDEVGRPDNHNKR